MALSTINVLLADEDNKILLLRSSSLTKERQLKSCAILNSYSGLQAVSVVLGILLVSNIPQKSGQTNPNSHPTIWFHNSWPRTLTTTDEASHTNSQQHNPRVGQPLMAAP